MNSNVWQFVLKPWRAATGLLAAAGLIMVAFSNPATPSTQTRFEFTEPHMGTLFRIVLYAPSAGAAARASRAAFDRVAALDDIMSDYRADSELMRMCRQAGGPPVKVSGDLFRVLVAAQDIAARSDGAFDVTVGPVVRLWRAARRSHHLPDPQWLTEAESHVGFQRIRLDPETQTVQLTKRGMLLDLGGIAKGYAADAALAVLRQSGINCALVAGGGDIAVGDPPPGKEGWSIGIEQLGATSGAPSRFVMLHNAAISTSGDAEQHVEIAGVRYSHIVDPKTGQALTGRRSATVIAPNCTTSDALATAVCVLGPKRAVALIDSLTGASMLMVVEGSGGLETFESKFPIPAREPNHDAR